MVAVTAPNDSPQATVGKQGSAQTAVGLQVVGIAVTVAIMALERLVFKRKSSSHRPFLMTL